MVLWPVLVGLLIAAGSAAQAQDAVEPGVIRFQNREIATLYAPLGSLSPQDRANAAMLRLSRSTERELRAPITVIPYGDARAVVLGDRMMFGIVADDVDPTAGETVETAAELAAENLRAAITARVEQRRPEVIVGGSIRVLLACVVAMALLLALRRVRHFVERRLSVRAEQKLEKRHFRIFGQDLKGAAAKALHLAVNAATILALLAIAYSWVTYSLRQFPLTAPWGDGLAGFLFGTLKMIGLGVLRGIPEMIVVVLVLVVTRSFVGLTTRFFDAVEKGQVTLRGVHPDTADATRRIVTTLIWVFGVAVAYPFVPGSSSDVFKGISVLFGVMISLGSSGVINQAMSGMVVVFSRALKAGEYVAIGDYEGTVTEVGALSTKLRTKRQEEINIPNALLVSSTTKNYSRLAGESGVIACATAGIGYDAPWRVVHQIMTEAARRTRGVRREPAPFVRQSALSSFCVDYMVYVHLERPEDRLLVLSDLHANIQDVFNEAGIQIMTPAFESQPAEKIWVPKSQWEKTPGGESAGATGGSA
jgi:small-conductance mechanosensitive channel